MAKIKNITVGFGVSQATGPNAWLKSYAEMEIEFDKPEDSANKDLIWNDAWERVTDECAKQLKKFDD